MKLIRTALVYLVSLSLTLTPVAYAAGLALPTGDLVAPVIKHTPITHDIPAGKPIAITATVTDDDAVKEVILFYTEIGASDYKRTIMKRDLDSNNYTAELPIFAPPGVEYYIQASDMAGNTLLFGHKFSPLTVNVAVAAVEIESDSEKSFPAVKATPVVKEEEKTGINKWVWIGLGVVAVGALAGGGGSGSGDGPGPIEDTRTGTVNITGNLP